MTTILFKFATYNALFTKDRLSDQYISFSISPA